METGRLLFIQSPSLHPRDVGEFMLDPGEFVVEPEASLAKRPEMRELSDL